ncbi:DNA oxidative demethylase ALKBH2-like [Argiope bruennichi]|uniref:DNA oxidative demethylase ALKBH2-like n=1 Tax=Argiope bruennichi TaxID=94029 RepID=UPI002495455A|nr:DNA oxidative demethylase ALKBH2-like [Argiope bruennichi]
MTLKMIIDTLRLRLGYILQFTKEEADDILEQLEKQICYLPPKACLVWGKYPIPRTIASYGDPGLTYQFAGGTFKAIPWIPILEQIANIANQFLSKNERFNYVLINRYADGKDWIGSHQDNEPDICPHTPIIIFSFGAQRELVFKRIQYNCKDQPQTFKITLEHGSILIMYPPTNEYYTHKLPKRLRCKDVRISLTFRKIRNKDG